MLLELRNQTRIRYSNSPEKKISAICWTGVGTTALRIYGSGREGKGGATVGGGGGSGGLGGSVGGGDGSLVGDGGRVEGEVVVEMGGLDVIREARPLQVIPPRQNKSDNITIEALKQCVSLMRAEAAKMFNVSKWTFRQRCRKLGIKVWPKLPSEEGCPQPVTMPAATDAREQQEVGQKRAKDVNIIPCDKKKKQEDESTSQDIEGDHVMDLKIYGAGRVIKLQFSLSNGLQELKQEVGVRLELSPESFNLTYKDNEEEHLSMPLDIDLKKYLTSASSPVIRLWAIKW
ncbi:hypothetical protein Vadar_018264 [Vaccinium darrowii]|uniref:Uncharacterized protein n=1 Tax=Vaccinium darrowii TaxID=229202 RepID=A0ACB7X1P0_9ERIC|nr:hypothetical protein Vadar_018264 [Vaccinium darrowii]